MKKVTPKKIGSAIGALILVLIAAYFEKDKEVKPTAKYEKISSSSFDYTRHAKYRMGCRFLSQDEVEDVIQNGRVNRRKSNPKAKPCPVTAVEKRTKDHQMARVVYGKCHDKIKIITVIDLDTDHPCSCK